MRLRSPSSFSAARTAIILFLLLLIFYSLLLSVSYFVDGLNFAKAIEDADIASLYFFHPHHLLYAPTGYIFYKAASLVGYTGRAVTILQVISAVMGAAGISIFSLLLRKLNIRCSIALTSSLFLAFSYGYWYHSVNVKSTVPALALLIVSFYFLIDFGAGIFKPILCGIFHGGSMLFHQVHILFVVPVLVFFILSGRKKNIGWYFLGLIPSVCIPYITVGGFIAELRSVSEFFHWTTLYLHSELSYLRANISNLISAVRSVGISLFGGHYFFLKDFRLLLFAGGISIVSLFLFVSLFQLASNWKRFRNQVFYTMIAFSISYGIFHLFWCPDNYSFWVIQLLPFFSLLALLWNGENRSRRLILPLILGIYFGLNLFGNIIPKHGSPPQYVQFIYELREKTAKDDLFIILGLAKAKIGYTEYIDPNIHYSLDRDYLTLPQIVEDQEGTMDEIEDRIDQGADVYLWWDFTPQTIERLNPPQRDGALRLLSTYNSVPAFLRGEMVMMKLVPVGQEQEVIIPQE